MRRQAISLSLIHILRADVMEKVIKATIPAELLDENTKYYINPVSYTHLDVYKRQPVPTTAVSMKRN